MRHLQFMGIVSFLLPFSSFAEPTDAERAQRQNQELMQIHQKSSQEAAMLMNQNIEKVPVQNPSGYKGLTNAALQRLRSVDEKALFRCAMQKKKVAHLSHPVLRKRLEQECKLGGRSPIQPDDRPEDLVDRFVVKSLNQLDQYRSAALPESPWSDDYWAIYSGILGKRYSEGQPGSQDWKRNLDFVISNPVSSYLPTKVDLLSPSEKYDLLLGIQDPVNTAGSLTKYSWDEGRGYYESNGKVEDWMGICHGWAPAAFMDARPLNPVTTLAADGKTNITFFPSDMKALTSMLWANAESDSRFIGRRCDSKRPREDENGRVLEEECADNNPATVLLAAINQIGVSKRSFVIDATYDYEVWNQPVHSYSFSYFNPETGRRVNTMNEAVVNYDTFKAKDKFKKYRSANTKTIIGINMSLQYVMETSPSARKVDTPAYDSLSTANYVFDLEVDAQGNILGGEWYNNSHPDFLWTPAPNDVVHAYGDQRVSSNWTVGAALPTDWQNAGKLSSQYGQPLGRVVRGLVAKSRATK